MGTLAADRLELLQQTGNKTSHKAILALLDLIALMVSWEITLQTRALASRLSYGQLHNVVPPLSGLLILWAAAAIWFGIYAGYENAWVGSRLRRYTESVLFFEMSTIVFAFFSREFNDVAWSRSFVALFNVISSLALVGARSGGTLLTSYVARRWPAKERVAIAGCERHASDVLARVKNGDGVEIVGLIKPARYEEHAWAGSVTILGTTDSLAEVINLERIQRVIIADQCFSEEELERCASVSKRMGVIASRAVYPPSATIDGNLALNLNYGVPLVDIHPVMFRQVQECIKRILDVVLASVSLIVLSPMMVCFGILIKLSSPGPIMHRALRVGKGGRYFTFYKFRSMVFDPDGRRKIAGLNEKGGHLFKIRNDPRLTSVGRVMRRFSIDELPQLFNVLLGDMSMVGPRPLPVEDLNPDGGSSDFAVWAELRHRVPPGITGLWQVGGRSELPFEAMIELDMRYITLWSFRTDLAILFKTPFAVLSGRGAY